MSIKLRTPYVLTLLKTSAPPALEPSVIKLYARDDGSGTVELFVRNADGTDTKITNDGDITAGALLNATGIVTISPSPAPTMGRALIATSTTTATWQDLVTSTDPAAVDVNPAVLGDSLTAARGDHKHSVLTAAPVTLPIGSAQFIGSATTLARSDHVHTTPGLATTTVSGYMVAADKAKLNGIAAGADVTLTALSTAVVDIAVNNRRITGLGDPSNAQDACTKAYADAVTQGLDVKQSCRAIATSNIVQSGTQTIDGVAVQAGNRVLCAGQTAGETNGIYVAAAGAWTRALDADTSADVTSGIFTFIVEGTSNADSGWVLITVDPIVLGTTPLAFTQFSGAGQIQAGTGLTKTGNTLNVVANADGSIVVAADDVRVGVLANDTQHGNRGGGALHAVATTGAAGFLSGSDKTKLDNAATGPGSSGGGNIVSFADGSGKALQDSGVSATSHAGRHLPGGGDTVFAGTWNGEDYPIWAGSSWFPRRRATRRKGGTQSTTSTGWVDIDDLTCANVTNGYYTFDVSLAYRTGSTGDGAGFRPSYSTTNHNAGYVRLIYSNATASEVWYGSGFDDPPALTSGPGPGTTLARITGTFAADNPGTFSIQMRSESGGSVSILIGSCVFLEKM